MWNALGNFLSGLGPEYLLLALLLGVLFVVGLVKEWWVLGPTHREMRNDRNFWRGRGELGTALAEVSTAALEAEHG